MIIAYQDIAALHRLEEAYTQSLATTDQRSAESWKREIRKAQADAGHKTPSEDATARKAERRIEELQ